MGRVDGRLTRAVLAAGFFRTVAHVDLLDVADPTQGRLGHVRRAEDKPLVRRSDYSQSDKENVN
jgi:hypothetical protein